MNTRRLLLAAALAVISPSLIADETLGRLFFTPEKRQALDYQRQFNIQERQEAQEDPTLTIDGVVMRSSGRQTVWVNGSAQEEREDSQGSVVKLSRSHPGKVIVQSEDNSSATAQVGDTLNRTTGETTELLRGGRIIIKAAPTR